MMQVTNPTSWFHFPLGLSRKIQHFCIASLTGVEWTTSGSSWRLGSAHVICQSPTNTYYSVNALFENYSLHTIFRKDKLRRRWLCQTFQEFYESSRQRGRMNERCFHRFQPFTTEERLKTTRPPVERRILQMHSYDGSLRISSKRTSRLAVRKPFE